MMDHLLWSTDGLVSFLAMRKLFCFCVVFGGMLLAGVYADTPVTEPDVAAWRLWARDKDAAAVIRDDQVRHGGCPTIRVEHTGTKDWSLEPGVGRTQVKADDMLELSAWMRV